MVSAVFLFSDAECGMRLMWERGWCLLLLPGVQLLFFMVVAEVFGQVEDDIQRVEVFCYCNARCGCQDEDDDETDSLFHVVEMKRFQFHVYK